MIAIDMALALVVGLVIGWVGSALCHRSIISEMRDIIDGLLCERDKFLHATRGQFKKKVA